MTSTEFRAALKALGLSQRAFASPEMLDVDVHTVNRWATGALPVPRYAEYVLELLHRAMNSPHQSSFRTIGQ